MEPKWIENQAKAIADYASIKYEWLHSEAHDHLMLYVEDVLREAQERAIPDEPTEEMIEAGRQFTGDLYKDEYFIGLFKAMIAKAREE